MASSSLLLLSLSVVLLLAIGADARPGVHFHPCKTFIISSYTISTFKPQFDLPQNPNSLAVNTADETRVLPTRYFAVLSQINNDFHPRQPRFDLFVDRHHHHHPRFESTEQFQLTFPRSIPMRDVEKPDAPFVPFGVTNSLRERTKDILSVVAALLFGVGCGALTSATMYLIWSIITNRYEIDRDMDDEDFYDDVNPKKMGYSMIVNPAEAAAVPAPAPAKEVV